MDDLSTLMNLSRSIGVDADLEDGAAWNRSAAPAAEMPRPLYGSGCIFAAAADEWVPVRFAGSRHHWV